MAGLHMETGGTRKMKGGAFPQGHGCAAPGCDLPGDYRAPRHRPGSSFAPPAGPPQWQYFCLEHVRAFNAGWNYFEGMDADEIWEAQTPGSNWDREVRAFAHNAMHGGPDRVEDALGVLRWKSETRVRRHQLSVEDRRALSVLGLPDSATLADVKAAYRNLARRYHPDANGGSRKHEARFQKLTEAASHLQQSQSFRQFAGAS